VTDEARSAHLDVVEPNIARDRDWRSRVIDRSLGEAADRAVARGQAFITAARRLLLASGGEDFTMQQVASEAGLSLRALYQHFDGKDDLLVALVEESQVYFAQTIEDHISDVEDPLHRLSAALLFATRRESHSDEGYTAALARYGLQTSITAPERLGRARQPVLDLFSTLVRDAADAGAIEETDPPTAAATLYLCFVAYGTNEYLGTSLGTASPPSEEFVRFCIQGLGASLPAGWQSQFARKGTGPISPPRD
jgi:AcrR family transcriptional regulator